MAILNRSKGIKSSHADLCEVGSSILNLNKPLMTDVMLKLKPKQQLFISYSPVTV